MGAYENDLKFKSRYAKERNFNRPKEIKMYTNRLFNLFAISALLLLTACAPQVAATPNA